MSEEILQNARQMFVDTTLASKTKNQPLILYCDCTDFREGFSFSVEAQEDSDFDFLALPNDATTVFTKTVDTNFSDRMGSLFL